MILSLLAGCTGVITLDPSTAPGEPEAVEPLACEEVLPEGLAAELAWSVSLPTYGDWGGLHAFSPDGEQLVTAADVYTPHVFTFDTDDGSYSVTKEDVYPWSRDEDWTVEARGVGWDDGAVVDLITGESLVVAPQLGEVWMGTHGIVSGDGSRLASVDCNRGDTGVEIWSVREGERILSLTIPDTCDYSPPQPGQVALTQDGSMLFTAAPERGQVIRVDVDSGGVDIFQAHAEIEVERWTTTGFIHAVTLLAGDDVLVTVGADGWLRQWDPETLAPLAPAQASTGTLVNENLYANPATYSPVDRSPDGTVLAALDAEGELVLKRACDGSLLTTLPSLTETHPPGWNDNPGAVAVAFHPAGDRVAVRYEHMVALWAIVD